VILSYGRREKFGGGFPTICNHCVVMAASNRETWKFCEQFVRFYKTTPMVKFSKFCSQSLHGDTDRRCLCSNVVKFVRDGKSVKSCIISDKKFSCFLNCR